MLGAHALAVAGRPRATQDLDIFVEPGPAWSGRVVSQMGDVQVPFLGPAELKRNKRASGRPKDIADLALLAEIEDEET